MRKVQLLIVTFLMIIGFVVSNEFYIDYISGFYDMKVLDFTDVSDNSKESVLMLEKFAQDYNVNLCLLIEEIDSAYSSKIKIYCTDYVKETIKNERELIEGEHKGIVSGSVSIEYDSLEHIPKENFDNGIEKPEIFLFGKDNTINQFYEEISKFCEINISGNDGYLLKQAQQSALMVWGIILAIICVLSYYVIQTEKKENVIKISLGANVKVLMIKNAIIEVLIICGSFETVRLILGLLQYTDFNIGILRVMVYIVSIICMFAQMSIMFFDISKVMSNAIISKDLIFMNCILKLVTTTIIGVLIVGGVRQVKEYYEYSKMKDYYLYYKDYNLVNVKPRRREAVDNLWYYEEKLFRDNLNSKKLIYFVEDTLLSDNTNMVSANKYAEDYIKDNIAELSTYDFEEKVYIIYNTKMKLTDEMIKEAKSISQRMYLGEKVEYVHLTYESTQKIAYISRNLEEGTGIAENPVIVFNNILDDRECVFGSPVQYGIFFNAVLWNCTKEEIAEEIRRIDPDNNITAEVTNAYDSYLNELITLKRMAMFKLSITLVLIIVYIIVTRLLVQILYTAESIEIAVKKTLGYNMFNRYKKIFVLSFIFDIFSIGYMKFYTNSSKYFGVAVSNIDIILIGLILFALDVLVLSMCVYRQERVNVIKTLKGGCL